MAAMFEEDRAEGEGFTEALDPNAEPGEIPADVLEDAAGTTDAPADQDEEAQPEG